MDSTMDFFNQQERISTEEASKLLGVTKHTIYRYEKEGKLSPIFKYTWHKEGSKFYYKEDVERLRQQEEVEGLKVKDVAERLHVSVSTVMKYIKEEKLIARKEQYKGKDTFFIEEEHFQEFQKKFEQPVTKRKEFVLKKGKEKYVLFQLFHHPQTNQKGRLIEMASSKGNILLEDERMVSLSDALKQGFVPVEQVAKQAYNSKRGYVTFSFPKPLFIYATVYKIMDLFYRHCGSENIRMEVKEKTIEVEVKPTYFPLSPMEIEAEVQYLQQYVQEGQVIIRPNGLFLESDTETITFHVSKQEKAVIKQLCEQRGIGQEEFILSILRQYMKNG
jgi:DNA-binding transcriptional MerR regulator